MFNLHELIVAALFCVGLFQATQYEVDESDQIVDYNVLWFLSYYGKKLPQLLYKPLIGCPQCMGSVWGATFYFVVFQHQLSWWVVIFMVCLSALNGIFNRFIDG